MLTIEKGILDNPKKLVQKITEVVDSKLSFVVLSDEIVKPLYANSLQKNLLSLGLNSIQLTFPSGEIHKSRATKELLENMMLAENLGSDSCIIAIGGGVTTDLGGFLSATYCRGISLILIPTTLLAMCDASIGGKNGVNTPYGKNLIGTTIQPKSIIIDQNCLKTLNAKEIKEGLVEIIKHAIIADSALFTYLENAIENVLALKDSVLEKIISESIRIKTTIVEEDRQIKGKRHLLNFGHTIGHALENLSSYSLSHGAAVALGMVLEANIAVQLERLGKNDFERIYKLLDQLGFSGEILENLLFDDMMKNMILDKKSIEKKPRFVFLNGIGSCDNCNMQFCQEVEESLILTAFKNHISNFL